MAKPERFRAGALLAVVTVVFVVAATAYALISRPGGAPGGSSQRGGAAGQALWDDLNPAEALEVNGMWKLEVVRGEMLTVAIDADEATRRRVDVQSRGGTLSLDLSTPTARQVHGTVTMPTISDIEIVGASSLELFEFDLARLSVSVDGAGRVVGQGMAIGTLELAIDGAAQIDFIEAEVVDAELNIEGAAKVDLTMAGGYLRGGIDGASQVEYRGSVSENTVEIDGIGSVRHVD